MVLIVVIPVYNESEIIETVVTQWISVLEHLAIDYKIRLYNDGSSDSTPAVLEKLFSRFQNRLEIVHKLNSGHGPTLIQAYRESVIVPWIFQVDSDNEISEKQFEQFWNVRHDFDFVIGIRRGRQFSPARRLISFFSALTVRVLWGKGIPDVNVPFRLMRADKFSKIFDSLPPDTFAPNIIISGMAVKKGLRIKVLEVDSVIRKTGSSSLSTNWLKLLRISLRSFQQVVAYAFFYKKSVQ